MSFHPCLVLCRRANMSDIYLPYEQGIKISSLDADRKTLNVLNAEWLQPTDIRFRRNIVKLDNVYIPQKSILEYTINNENKLDNDEMDLTTTITEEIDDDDDDNIDETKKTTKDGCNELPQTNKLSELLYIVSDMIEKHRRNECKMKLPTIAALVSKLKAQQIIFPDNLEITQHIETLKDLQQIISEKR